MQAKSLLVSACLVMIAAGQAHGQDCALSVTGETARQMVSAEADRQKVDTRLAVAVAEQESQLGRSLNSPSGAKGIMQLMPETAAIYGVTDICDPAENIRGGISFLKDLSTKYDGNVMLVLAAYNAGIKRVEEAKGIPAIPETVRYVAAVTNAYYSFKNSFTHKSAAKSSLNLAEKAPASAGEAQELHWIGGTVLNLTDGE